MKRCGIIVVLIGLLSFVSTALADEATKHDEHGQAGHEAVQELQNPVKEEMTSDMQMDGDNSHSMTMEEHQNMNMNMDMDMGTREDSVDPNQSAESGGHGGHGGHGEEVVETPPNIPVLSTFAGIMTAFILYGACRKWLLKKGRAQA
ncbi:hypothetical protein [Paenibacillus sp. Aloe-11]|uniref:hypothetical protein n=1 Tax=Paenibacillus sp. Aloe-11 TaxID=1050222 RepID=UPI00024EF860|nr:hypothetical protein [Paenibacillus sp. Aloe-11]EHS57759.1 hypothetical protein WG8_2232 [Paenibacillus sp. Aloe-11]